MRKLRLWILSFSGALICLFGAQSAEAACSNPAGTEGYQIYNTTHKVMQYCDGTTWISMKGGVGTATDTLTNLNCTDGQVAQWNNTSGLWECATLALGCTRRSSAFGATVTVSCQAGEVLTGGGCSASGSGAEKGIKRSYPSADATWLCERDDTDITVQAWAVCCSFQF